MVKNGMDKFLPWLVSKEKEVSSLNKQHLLEVFIYFRQNDQK